MVMHKNASFSNLFHVAMLIRSAKIETRNGYCSDVDFANYSGSKLQFSFISIIVVVRFGYAFLFEIVLDPLYGSTETVYSKLDHVI
jgi:hypothetical protein